jgi:hypothetical protein
VLDRNSACGKKEPLIISGTDEVVPIGDMKAYRGSRVKLHSFLTLALNRGEWSTSRLDHCTPEKTALLPMEWKACSSQELIWTFLR